MAPNWLVALGFVTTAAAGITAPVVTAILNRRHRREEETWVVIDAAALAVGHAVDAIEDCFVIWTREASDGARHDAVQSVHACAEPVRYSSTRLSMRLGGDHPVVVSKRGFRDDLFEIWSDVIDDFESGGVHDKATLEHCRGRLGGRRDEFATLVHRHFVRPGWPQTGGLFGAR